MSNVAEAVALAVVLGGCGLLCIVLGRKGRAGAIDYSWGHHQKSDVEPEVWARAHVAAGKAMETAGWWYAIGALAAAVLLVLSYQVLSTVVGLGSVATATVLLFVGIYRGLQIITE